MLELNQTNNIILLKLGGSLITDKKIPFSFNDDIIKAAVHQIIQSGKRIILIHGGGSFGHPIAKIYKLNEGRDESIENQILGITETHAAMEDLNSKIINVFMEKRYPAMAIQPSSIFTKTGDKVTLHTTDTIERALDLGIMPVLYGDVLLDHQKNFSILSGDQIILELCRNLKTYSIIKVIFAMDIDGIFVKALETIKLINKISCNELDNLNLASLDEKIDVTGNIRGKINVCKEIGTMKIPINLINGSKENYIYKALMDENLNCTIILT